MDSVLALQELQKKVVQLETKLNRLADWISHKFADDHSLPSDLRIISAPSFHQDENILPDITDAQFETIPLNSTIKTEVYDDYETTERIADMETFNSEEVEPSFSSPRRTRQWYECTVCNRKFHGLTVLRKHQMNHCYVRIKSSDSIKIQGPRHQRNLVHRAQQRSSDPDPDFEVEQDSNELTSADSGSDSSIDRSLPKEKVGRKSGSGRGSYTNKSKLREPKLGEFVCRVCDKNYDHERGLRQHMKVYHPEEYRVDMEERKCVKQENFRIRPCDICQERFTSKYLARQHKIKCHPEEIEKEKEWKVARSSISGKAFRCRICKDGKLYRTFWFLNKHKSEAHNIQLPSTSSPVGGRCEECDITFSTLGNQVTHNRAVHLKLKPFVCPECGKSFAKKHTLNCHMDLHKDIKQYACPHCQKAFQQREGLTMHIRRKHRIADNKAQCFHCGLLFQNLKTHIQQVHEDVRPFSCSICDQKFKKKSHMNDHMKTHDNPNGRKRGSKKGQPPLPNPSEDTRVEPSAPQHAEVDNIGEAFAGAHNNVSTSYGEAGTIEPSRFSTSCLFNF